MECLDSDSFTFPGASHVTAVNILGNDVAALPEKLLWNMTSLLQFKAMSMLNLRNVPERFFMFQRRLEEITFTESNNLGRGEPLPDGLFKGLASLTTLYLDECGYQTLPNMDDLTNLTVFRANDGQLRMNNSESESKFDGLESVELLMFDSNLLTRVPSLKNLGALQALYMSSNRIETIFPGDFAGAKSLVVLTLGGNHITSVDSKAFSNLAVFRVKPDQFDPRQADGKPFQDALGIGLWPHAGVGHFGGGQEWASVPISFAPNPAQCRWLGPLFSDFDCRHCHLGYEASDGTDDETVQRMAHRCVKPRFRPFRNWYDHLRVVRHAMSADFLPRVERKCIQGITIRAACFPVQNSRYLTVCAVNGISTLTNHPSKQTCAGQPARNAPSSGCTTHAALPSRKTRAPTHSRFSRTTLTPSRPRSCLKTSRRCLLDTSSRIQRSSTSSISRWCTIVHFSLVPTWNLGAALRPSATARMTPSSPKVIMRTRTTCTRSPSSGQDIAN